jgi:hypothetical protein
VDEGIGADLLKELENAHGITDIEFVVLERFAQGLG